MSSVPSMYNTASNNNTSTSGSDRFQELDTQAFLKMMIAELQNQDPLNPMDNAKMLEQISQIRSITSNDALTGSIESLKMGQSMATAAGLIGKTVIGLDVIGQEVVGVVDKVAFEDGKPYLFVGQTIIELDNIYGMAETPTISSGGNDETDDNSSQEENKENSEGGSETEGE